MGIRVSWDEHENDGEERTHCRTLYRAAQHRIGSVLMYRKRGLLVFCELQRLKALRKSRTL